MTCAGYSYHLPNPQNHSAVRNSARLHCLYFPFPPALSFTFFHRSVKPSQQWLIVIEQSHPSVSTAWHKHNEGYLEETLLLFKLIPWQTIKILAPTVYKELTKSFLSQPGCFQMCKLRKSSRNEKPQLSLISLSKITKAPMWSTWHFWDFFLISKNFILLTAALLGEKGLHFRNHCIWISWATNYRFCKGWEDGCAFTHICVYSPLFFSSQHFISAHTQLFF